MHKSRYYQVQARPEPGTIRPNVCAALVNIPLGGHLQKSQRVLTHWKLIYLILYRAILELQKLEICVILCQRRRVVLDTNAQAPKRMSDTSSTCII